MKTVNYTHFAFFISFFALFTLGSCQTTKNHFNGIKAVSDREEMNLHGNVKSLTKRKFRASMNRKTGEFIKKDLPTARPMNISYTFNENGNIIEKTDYATDGSVHRTWKYDYYSKKGEIIERVFNDANEQIFKRIDQYDRNGNKIKHLGYSKGDDEPYIETFAYDKNGNLLKEVAYKASGPKQVTYTYNEDGNLIEIKQGGLSKTFEYDADGNLVSTKRIGNRTVHSLYENDKKVEGSTYKNGEPKSRFAYTYDDKGNRIGFKTYTPDGSLKREGQTRYEYDEKNNWIRKIPLNRLGIPRHIIERKIAYY